MYSARLIYSAPHIQCVHSEASYTGGLMHSAGLMMHSAASLHSAGLMHSAVMHSAGLMHSAASYIERLHP